MRKMSRQSFRWRGDARSGIKVGMGRGGARCRVERKLRVKVGKATRYEGRKKLVKDKGTAGAQKHTMT